jgi:hypothetical protein
MFRPFRLCSCLCTSCAASTSWYLLPCTVHLTVTGEFSPLCWSSLLYLPCDILPIVLYGCKIWFLALREEHRLRAFENRVLRKIFWSMRAELTEYWRNLHSEKLHNLVS